MDNTQSFVTPGLQHSPLPGCVRSSGLNPLTSYTGPCPHVIPFACTCAHATPSLGPMFVTRAATCANTSGTRPNINVTNQMLYEKVNKKHIVPVSKLEFPEYCFVMKTDFTAKITDKVKSRANVCQEQIAIVGLVLSALLNTCGGFLALLNILRSGSTIVNDWRNNINKQMQHIPKWIFRTCISMPILKQKGIAASLAHTKGIMMFVKKSPKTITYNTHMFVRSSDAHSELADSDNLISVLQIDAPTTYTPHHTTDVFTKRINFQYGEVLPPESLYIEYKNWKVNSMVDVIKKIKNTRNTKGLFSLANNVSGGFYIIGVDDKSCQVKGIIMSQSDKTEFRIRLASWMTADDAGVHRIWGSEGHMPRAGTDYDWEVMFIPVMDSPGDTDAPSDCNSHASLSWWNV